MTHAESLALNDTGRASATLVPPLCHPCASELFGSRVPLALPVC